MPASAVTKLRRPLAALGLGVGFFLTGAAYADDLTTCKMHPADKLSLSFAGSLLNPVVPATINGHPTLARISTESGSIRLSKAFLRDLGIPTQRTNHREYVAGGGVVRIYTASVEDLKIGPMAGSGDYEVEEMSKRFGVALGMNAFARYDLELGIAGKYLRFFRPEKCKGVSLAYWEGEATSLPFTVTSRDFSPQFTIKINGKEVPAELNLTQPMSILDLNSAKAAGFSPDMPGAIKESSVIMGGGNTEVWSMPVDQIDIGAERINKVRMMVADTENVNGMVILGRDFILAHRILVSMSQQRMYFSYLGGPLFSTFGSDNKNPWFRAEAEQGNPDAQYRMGTLFDTNPTPDMGLAEAMVWFNKAAAQGQPDAQYRVGLEHFMNADFKESARLFREAAASNEPHLAANEMLYLSEARLGNSGAAASTLKEAVDAPPAESWNKRLIMLHSGEISGETLLAEVEAGSKGWQIARRCSAYVQIGEAHLLKARLEAAKSAFGAALTHCRKNSSNQRLALAELARLDAAPRPSP